jgi:bacterioferritin-associated ferredoxin
MIVCVCRRISDRKISEMIDGGARTAGAIFQASGCKPQCGTCLPFVKAAIRQALTPPPGEASGAVAPTGAA